MENIRIEVESKLMWKHTTRFGERLLDACVVTVTRIYRDGSFRVQDADGKDKGRFKDHGSRWSRDERPEVSRFGNDGWGNTSGTVYPLPKNVTDISLKAEINSQKATKAKEEADAQAERDERWAQIIEAQEGRLTSRWPLTIDPELAVFKVLTKKGNELIIIYSFEIRDKYDFKTEETYHKYYVTAQAYGKIRLSGEKSWTSLTRNGRTIDEALKAIAVSLWD